MHRHVHVVLAVVQDATPGGDVGREAQAQEGKGALGDVKNFEKIIEYTGSKAKEISATDGCPYSEIAVLYAMKNPGKNLKAPLPEMIASVMESNGILSKWVSEDYRAKSTHDITTNSVTISTIHSVKGLDYAAVFLLGVDFLEPHIWSVEQIEKLIYVAITRARYQLFIPYMVENQFIAKLKACL